MVSGRFRFGADVHVEVVDGVATLRGSVATRAEGADLVRAVRDIPGIREVQGLLRVRSERSTGS